MNQLHFKKYYRFYFFWGIFFTICGVLNAQNSIVGDGFGGRLWYKPSNLSAAPYGGFTTCNGELYGWGVKYNTTKLINLSTSHYFAPTPAYNMTNVKYHSAGYSMTVIKNNDSAFFWESFYNSRPVGILDEVKFCDGGWIMGAFVKKDGTAFIASNGKNPRLLNLFEHNHRDTVRDSFYHTINSNTTLIKQEIMVQDVKGVENVVRCAVGVHCVYFLTEQGDVYVIAEDEGTSIGLGNLNSVHTPLKIPGLKDIIDIKTTTWGSIALDKNGDIFLWYRFFSNPYKVTELSNIVAISGQCDGWIALALKANGDVYEVNYKNQIYSNPPLSKLNAQNVLDIIAGETFYYLYYGNDSFSYHSLENNALQNDLGTLRIGTDFKLMLPCITDKSATPFLICKGDSLKIYNRTFKQAGFYDILYNDSLYSIRLILNDTFSRRTFYEYCKSNEYPHSRIDTTRYQDEDGTCVTQIDIINVNPTFEQIDSFISCNQPIVDYAGNTIYSDTQYTHRYTSSKGCDSIYKTVVTIYPQMDTTVNLAKCIGDDFRFLNKTYSQSGSFKDTIKNHFGCDSIIYSLNLYDTSCGLTVYIPNVFTPNNKGPEINNTFLPYVDNHKEFQMIILNRWGDKLYETNNYYKGWDGTYLNEPCQDGVYVYHLKVTSKSLKTYEYSGTVTLIR